MKKRIINILLAFTLVITGTIGASGIGVLAAGEANKNTTSQHELKVGNEIIS
jgi:hypothetical protein